MDIVKSEMYLREPEGASATGGKILATVNFGENFCVIR